MSKISTISTSIICAIMSLLFIGCSGKDSMKESSVPDINLIISTEKTHNILPHIDSVAFISLQSGKSLIISSITKLLIDKEKNIFLLANTGIYKFDRNGRIEHSFGRVGRGPGEYLKIYDICLNLEENEIWCLDHMNNVMKFNTNTGEYIETIGTKSKEHHIPNASGLAPATEDGFYLYVPNPDDVSNIEDDFFCLKEFDKKGKLVAEHIKRRDFNLNMPAMPSISQSYGNRYIVRPQENENICYQITDGKLSKFCKIHFGDLNIPPLFAFKDNKDPWANLQDLMASRYYKIPFNVHITENDLFVSANGPKGSVCSFVIDRTSQKGINWDNGRNNITTPFFILGSDEEFFYGLFDKYNIDESSDMKDADPLLRHLIKDRNLVLKDADNPIIVKLKFSSFANQNKPQNH